MAQNVARELCSRTYVVQRENSKEYRISLTVPTKTKEYFECDLCLSVNDEQIIEKILAEDSFSLLCIAVLRMRSLIIEIHEQHAVVTFDGKLSDPLL